MTRECVKYKYYKNYIKFAHNNVNNKDFHVREITTYHVAIV